MRIAILDDYQDVARQLANWNALTQEQAAELTVFTQHLGHDDEVVCRALQDFEVIVAMRERTPFPGDRLRRLPNLRLLVTTGMRNAAIDMEVARELGITVCGTGGSPTAAAEHTWALILAAARRLEVELFSSAKPRHAEHPWQQSLGTGLSGKTLGIYGLGNLGSQVARIGQAFGMEVIAYSQHLDHGHARELGVRPVGERELFSASDVLSIHLKLSGRTTAVVGSGQLELMKPGSILVNTSRSAIVDGAALARALDTGAPQLAAIDVFEVEPLPATDPLLNARGIIATPHLGYVTEDQFRIFYAGAVEDIQAWIAGSPVRVLSG